MGQTCNCCKSEDYDNTKRKTRPRRRPQKINIKGLNYIKGVCFANDNGELNSSGDEDDKYGSSTSDVDEGELTPLSAESREKAISAFKEAVLRGNETLVIYYLEEFPNLDLLHLTFENGDNCLQAAIRNSSYNLIYYLLTNDISVKQY